MYSSLPAKKAMNASANSSTKRRSPTASGDDPGKEEAGNQRQVCFCEQTSDLARGESDHRKTRDDNYDFQIVLHRVQSKGWRLL